MSEFTKKVRQIIELENNLKNIKLFADLQTIKLKKEILQDELPILGEIKQILLRIEEKLDHVLANRKIIPKETIKIQVQEEIDLSHLQEEKMKELWDNKKDEEWNTK